MIMLARSSERMLNQMYYSGDSNNRGVQIEGKSETDKAQQFPHCILAANFPLVYIRGSGI